MAKFSWSTSRAEYLYSSNGATVSPDRIRGWVESTVEKAKGNLEGIARLRQAGDINNAEWVIRTGDELRNLHRSLSMIANGGRAQMTAQAWAQVGGTLRREFSYLNRFANELDNIPASATLTDEFVRRAASYANAGYSTYANAERQRLRAAGYGQERNILGAADHCEECKAETDRGWVELGTLKAIGTRQCLSNCRCHYEYRAAAEALTA